MRLPSPGADGTEPLCGKALLVAYACDPYHSMESRVGWNRTLHAARNHRVWVLYGGQRSPDELSRLAAKQAPGTRIEFVDVANSWLGTACDETFNLFWTRYRLWHRQALAKAKQLHHQHGFDFAHQVNFCSFREPGDIWKLGIPFIWGPVGGTQNFPLRFLSECDFLGGCREVIRNFRNTLQLRTCKRVRRAAKSAEVVFAATRLAQQDLSRCIGVPVEQMLETGVDCVSPELRNPPPTDRPFRLVWAGRQRTWKGLPLLLKALAKVAGTVDFELRVLGVGDRQASWLRLAKRLGIEGRVAWVGWPEYEVTVQEYAAADAFVFTSLRDTSGTGLLESLAAGTPIIGLNHQGAADILTRDCSMPIAVESPRQVVGDLSSAICRLASDPELWKSLSFGGKDRAKYFLWGELADRMESTYQRVLSAGREIDLTDSGQAGQPSPHWVSDTSFESNPMASV